MMCPIESASATSIDYAAEDPSPSASQHENRIAQLESTVAELQREVAGLREKIDSLFG